MPVPNLVMLTDMLDIKNMSVLCVQRNRSYCLNMQMWKCNASNTKDFKCTVGKKQNHWVHK